MPATCKDGQFKRKDGVIGTIINMTMVINRANFFPLSLVTYSMIPPVIVPIPVRMLS